VMRLLHRVNGMFAFACYRVPEGELALVRDHAGIKPLYWFAPPDHSGLAFGSQYDVLLRTPFGDPGRVRLDVLDPCLRLHQLAPPFGLLENTHRLAPGHWQRIGPDRQLEQRAWWTLPRSPEAEL